MGEEHSDTLASINTYPLTENPAKSADDLMTMGRQPQSKI